MNRLFTRTEKGENQVHILGELGGRVLDYYGAGHISTEKREDIGFEYCLNQVRKNMGKG